MNPPSSVRGADRWRGARVGGPASGSANRTPPERRTPVEPAAGSARENRSAPGREDGDEALARRVAAADVAVASRLAGADPPGPVRAVDVAEQPELPAARRRSADVVEPPSRAVDHRRTLLEEAPLAVGEAHGPGNPWIGVRGCPDLGVVIEVQPDDRVGPRVVCAHDARIVGIETAGRLEARVVDVVAGHAPEGAMRDRRLRC